jgi:electron transfer flavoprotein alpha subunit
VAIRIAVLVKQVPDIAEMRMDPDTRTLVREGVPAVMNIYDRTALSRALMLRDELGAEVVAVSMGPPQAVDVLRECLAGGADRAVLVSDPALAGSDTWVTAKVLAAALRRLGTPDLVLCGQHSTDSETGQVGPEIAALLGMTPITAAVRLDVDGRELLAVREVEGGTETVRGRLPALVSVVEAMVKPRRVHPRAYREVAAERVEVWDAAGLGQSRETVGLSGSPTIVVGVRADAPVRRREVLGGAPAAVELVRRLEAEGALGTGAAVLAPPGPVRQARGPCLLVVAESEAGGIHRGVAELCAEAGRVADELGGWVAALALGGPPDASGLAAAGADAVFVAPGLGGGYVAEAWAEAALAAIAELHPVAVLTPASARGRDWMPRVAAALDAGMVGDAIGLEVERADGPPRLLSLKPAFGGAVVAPIASRTVPLLTTIRAGTCVPHAADPTRSVPLVELSCGPLPAGALEVIGSEVDVSAAALAGARGAVVCAGLGVGGPEGIAEVGRFAAGIGAVLAGSRRVVDSGWLPRSRQVGISGQALVSRLYLGIGVRGAANHLVGLRRVGTVVAVNNDPNASIFGACDYGLVCDWREGVAALGDALAALRRPE